MCLKLVKAHQILVMNDNPGYDKFYLFCNVEQNPFQGLMHKPPVGYRECMKGHQCGLILCTKVEFSSAGQGSLGSRC